MVVEIDAAEGDGYGEQEGQDGEEGALEHIEGPVAVGEAGVGIGWGRGFVAEEEEEGEGDGEVGEELRVRGRHAVAFAVHFCGSPFCQRNESFVCARVKRVVRDIESQFFVGRCTGRTYVSVSLLLSTS